MIRRIRSLTVPLALSLALIAGACNGGGDDDALSQDTSLSRDLALANSDTAAQPQLQDVPANPPAATPAPSTGGTTRPAPRPTTPRPTTTRPTTPTTTPSGNTVATGAKGSEGATANVPAGTTISLASSDRVCTNTHRAGDRFTATVSQAVTASNGVVIPAGARAVVQVSSVKRSENANDPIQMGFVVQSISWGGKTYPVDATITDVKVDRVRASSTGNDAKKVAAGAVAGAIIGQILGKDTKSTVIGAATGAAAGTAVAMGTADYEGCVPQGGQIVIRLNSPATIQAD